jgi:hypothetical protein
MKENEMGVGFGTYGEKRNVYRALVGIADRRRRVGRPWRGHGAISFK